MGGDNPKDLDAIKNNPSIVANDETMDRELFRFMLDMLRVIVRRNAMQLNVTLARIEEEGPQQDNNEAMAGDLEPNIRPDEAGAIMESNNSNTGEDVKEESNEDPENRK